MNGVIAAASASAPSAGVLPGTTAGATPGAGPSFADVLRQLAGEDAPALGAGAARPTRGGATAGRTSDTDAAGDEVAGASSDPTSATGAVVGPVAVVLPPVTEMPPAEVTGDAAAAADDSTPLTGAHRAPAQAHDAAPLVAVGSPGPRARKGGRHSEFTLPPPAGAEPAAVAPSLDRQLGGAIGTSGAVGEGRPVTSGTVATADTTALQAGAVGPRRTGREHASTAADWSSITPSGRSAAPDAPMRTSSATTSATTTGALADAVSVTTFDGASQDADGASQEATGETPAASAPHAAVLARLMADLSRGPGRAHGLPRALARVLDGGPATERVLETPTAATPSPAAALPTDVATLVAALTAPTASAAGAAARGTHPGLSAALRAFQQAGAPVATGGAIAAPANTTTESVAQLVTAARSAGFTGGEPGANASDVQAGGRAFTLPSMSIAAAPSAGGDLRIGSGLGPSARLDAAGLATLAPADGDDVRAQLVQSIRVQWTGGSGEARVRLRPEHLGEVVATIKVEQGSVTATLQAERAEVRRWLETHTQTLRDGLVEHGLKLDRLVVLTEPARGDTRDDSQGRARGRQPQDRQPRPRRPRADDSGATFDLNT